MIEWKSGSTINLQGQKFELIQKLGEGTYGIVFKAKGLGGGGKEELYTIKVLHNQLDAGKKKKSFEVEKTILSILKERVVNCEHVACYENAFEEMSDFILITKFVSGQPIEKVIPKDGMQQFFNPPYKEKMYLVSWDKFDPIKPFQFTMNLLKSIIVAYMTLEDAGVIHRDIKTDNIIISHVERAKGLNEKGGRTGNNKIHSTFIDFGFGCTTLSIHNLKKGAKQVACEGLVGAPVYLSPEVWRYNQYTTQSDIYALGITFYSILTGEDLLFEAFDAKGEENYMVLRKNVLENRNRLPIKIYHVGLRRLVEEMTSYKPENRPTAKQVLDKLEQIHD